MSEIPDYFWLSGVVVQHCTWGKKIEERHRSVVAALCCFFEGGLVAVRFSGSFFRYDMTLALQVYKRFSGPKGTLFIITCLALKGKLYFQR